MEKENVTIYLETYTDMVSKIESLKKEKDNIYKDLLPFFINIVKQPEEINGNGAVIRVMRQLDITFLLPGGNEIGHGSNRIRLY